MMPDANEKPVQDEIIAEVRAIREALASEFGYDVKRLFEAGKRWESASGRPKRRPSPKRISPAPSV